MARIPRFSPGGLAYHVMNRTPGKLKLFEDDGDYQAFEKVLIEAIDLHRGICLCAYCLMPNHFHLLLYPKTDGQLSRFMQWLTMTPRRPLACPSPQRGARASVPGPLPELPDSAGRAFPECLPVCGA